jgi:hypothetical protein
MSVGFQHTMNIHFAPAANRKRKKEHPHAAKKFINTEQKGFSAKCPDKRRDIFFP